MISQAVISEIIHYKPVHIYFSEVIFRDISSPKKQCSEISLQFVCLHLQQVRYCFMMYYSNQVGVAFTFLKCSIFIYMFLNFMQKLKIMFFWTICIWYIRSKIYLNTADMSCALIYIVFNKFFISLYIINIFNNYCSVLYVYIKSISIFFSSSNAVFSFSFFIYNNVLFPLFINNVLKMAYRARS